MTPPSPARAQADALPAGAGDRYRWSDIARLWRLAPAIADSRGLKALRWRATFLAAAWRHRASLLPFLRPEGALARMLARRPETIGAVAWPYVCLSWDAPMRLRQIRKHWSAVEQHARALDFMPDETRDLLDLGDLMPGLRLVLDQPKWFMREGQAVLDLFIADTRIFSLAFALREEQGLVAVIGAIQGRDIEGALDTYRELTGALHGMRPRDFLVEMFRALCAALGVQRIVAVSDASRHHRSPYFGNAADKRFPLNYNEVWTERGGTALDADFFALPVTPVRRSIEEIPSKKRSMYRKRYEMLDRLEAKLRQVLSPQATSHGQAVPIAG